MIYADTDFFLALMKKTDWLKTPALSLYEKYKGDIWTSPTTLIELLLVAEEYELDPERIVMDAMLLAELRGGVPKTYALAGWYVKTRGVGVFDALHAAFCGNECQILSSDKVFDKIGLKRIPLNGDQLSEGV